MSCDAYAGQYPVARAEAFERSGGTCQFCGMEPARDAHHWALPLHYPSGCEVKARDLTALCRRCHVAATDMRKTREEADVSADLGAAAWHEMHERKLASAWR